MMYLLFIQVPFERVSKDAALVTCDWACALRLLRDSMQGRHGPIVVAAPELPTNFTWQEQKSVLIEADHEDIHFVGLCPAHLRAMRFWQHARKVYRRCIELAAKAEVVHAGMSDLFRPISQFGWLAAIQTNTPFVFVVDTDAAVQIRQLAEGRKPVRTELYCRLYDKIMRYAVAHADLSLLKGRHLHDRFQPYAKNAKCFHNTSYEAQWVIPASKLHEKALRISTANKLRCVYLGRLVARKEVGDTLRFIAELRKLGCDASLDIIGGGRERDSLDSLSAKLGIKDFVTFRGVQSYGEALLIDLRQYDLQVQTPHAEDTPRSLFDGLAAGLPLAAYEVDYLADLIQTENCGVIVPIGQFNALACTVMDLWTDKPRFVSMMETSAAVGRKHAVDYWYPKRAAWLEESLQYRQTQLDKMPVSQT